MLRGPGAGMRLRSRLQAGLLERAGFVRVPAHAHYSFFVVIITIAIIGTSRIIMFMKFAIEYNYLILFMLASCMNCPYL